MTRVLLVAGALAIVIGSLPHSCLANRAPIEREPVKLDPNVPFKISANRSTTDNRLIIPRKFLRNAVVTKGRKPSSITGSDLRTVIAGSAISLSAISLAFVLIRRRRKFVQLAALVVVAGGGAILCVDRVTADIAPPISEIPSTWKRVASGQKNVKIEIAEEGEVVELILGTYRSRNRREPRPVEPRDGSAAPPSEPSPDALNGD